MKVSHGVNLLVRGPCKIIVEEGLVDIFGKQFSKTEIYVPRAKIYPLRIVSDSELRFIGECKKTKVSELFTDSWLKAIEKIVKEAEKKKPIKILIIGFCDVGKSSFTIMLANALVEKGIKVGVVDSDIGQAKIGIPGVISSSIMTEKHISMDELSLDTFYFVGDNTPAGHLLQVLIGVQKVVKDLIENGVDAVIIDTTGMIFGGPARALKVGKISLLEPDIIVAIERENELFHIKTLIKKEKLIEVKSPPKIKRVPREVRINRRQEKIRELFKTSEVLSLNLDDIRFEYAFLTTGVRIQNPEKIFGENVIHAELAPDALLLVVKGSSRRKDILETAKRFLVTLKTVYLAHKLGMDVSERISTSPLLAPLGENSVFLLGSIIAERDANEISIQIVEENYYNGLLIGLSDENDEFIGLGIIEKIDIKNRRIKIVARMLKKGKIAKIWLGYLRYDNEFHEIGKRKIGLG